MKAIKYLLAGALLITTSTTALAQNDDKSVIEAVTKVISSKPENVEKAIKPYFKKNKKNPVVLVGIAQAFYDIKDYENAKHYCNLAIACNPQYINGYLLLGDIAVMQDDGGEAARQYEQAIYFAPKDPAGYYKYANIYRGKNPRLAVEKLKDLRIQRPDLAVDALAGRIFYTSNDLNGAISYYDKVTDLSKMEEEDLKNYSTACYLIGKPERSAEVAKFGLTVDPRDPGFNRLVFYNSTDLKKYDDAKIYAAKLFNESDSAKFTHTDYIYYGHLHMGLKEYDEAIDKFEKALDQNIEDKDQKAGIYSKLAEAYDKKNNFDKAVEYYNLFMSNKSKVYPSDYAGLARIYQTEAQNIKNASQSKDLLNKAFELYGKLTTADNEMAIRVYGLLQQGRIKVSFDPDTKEGLAKPFYSEIINLLENKANLDDSDKQKLVEAYSYCGYYNLNTNNNSEARRLYEKVLTLDPNNSQAKDVLKALK